jgi:hypothetical protein
MNVAAKRKRTAYHEAGHAVIARVLGVKAAYISMVPNEWSVAHVHFSRRWRSKQIKALVFKAGIVAERMAGFPRSRWNGRHDDEIIIEIIVEQIGGRRPIRNKNGSIRKIPFAQTYCGLELRLERKTEVLVARHWRDIERLARVLRRRDFLGAAEIERLLRAN